MGRKKIAASESAAMTLSGVIVKALETIGTEAATAAVKEWIGAQYPGVKTDVASFQSTLSVKRKKLRGGAPAKPKTRKPRMAKAVVPGKPPKTIAGPASSEPTLSDLLKVKAVADEQGGVDGLLTAVQAVRNVAAQVGGLEKLSGCLEALKKLRGQGNNAVLRGRFFRQSS
jgi:hypothetical protein